MGRRTWVKIYVDKWLRGTLREETASTRGIWIDILTLAGDSAFGDVGEIKLGTNVGMTDEQISKILFINLKEWLTTKQRLIETERIKIKKNNTIMILNWDKYQSEYQRQKAQSPKNHKKKDNVYPKVRQKVRGDRERDIEGDRDIDKNILSKDNRNFKKPSIKEIRQYCIDRKNTIDPEQFFDFYESKGWMVGKNKMKDWKACVRTWEKNSKQLKSEPEPITVSAAISLIQRYQTTSTMEEILNRLPEKDLPEFMTFVNKDNYLKGIYQRAKKILTKGVK